MGQMQTGLLLVQIQRLIQDQEIRTHYFFLMAVHQLLQMHNLLDHIISLRMLKK